MELALETMGKPIGVAELHPEAGQRPLVKIKVNSDKRTCFVSLFRNKNITFAYQYNDTNIHYMNKIVQPQWLEWAKRHPMI